MIRLSTLLVLSALAAQAQLEAVPQRTLNGDAWCDRDLSGYENSERRERACEVRETVLPATALDLDGTPNGSVTVKRWDRPDVLVRTRVLAYARDAADA